MLIAVALFLLLPTVAHQDDFDRIKVDVANIYAETEGKISSLAAMQMAERDLRDNGVIGSNVHFTYSQAPMQMSEGGGVGPVSDMRKNTSIDLILGPYYGVAMQGMLPAATYWDTMVVGHVSTYDALADKVKYPTFARVCNTMTSLGLSVQSFVTLNNWTRVALISSTASVTVVDGIKSAFKGTINIAYTYTFNSTTASDTEYDNVLHNIQSLARSNSARDVRPFMLAAMRNNMTTPSYVYIIPCPATPLLMQPAPWTHNQFSAEPNTVPDAIAKQAFASTYIIEALDSDQDSVMKADRDMSNFSNTQDYISMGILSETQPSFRQFLYNAMYLYGAAVNTCITAGVPRFWKSGKLMLPCFKYLSLPGIAGPISTNADADRTSAYNVKSIDSTGNYSVFYELYADKHLCTSDENKTSAQQVSITVTSTGNYTLSIAKLICPKYNIKKREGNWRTANNKPPPDTPTCGFQGELCVDQTDYKAIAAGVVVSALAAISLAGYCSYRQRQIKKMEMMNFSWKVNRADIQVVGRDIKNSLVSRGDLVGSIKSIGVQSIDAVKQTCGSNAAGYIGAQYKQNWVIVKSVPCAKQLDMKQNDLLQLRKIFEANHENLNRFIGLCVDSQPTVIILWNHCAKGTLKNVLLESEIELDYAFKSSILRDIIQGLDCLHNKSQLDFHGNLSSTSCLISSRWVVCLSDFGLDRILNPRFADGTLGTTFLDFEEHEVAKATAVDCSKEKDIFDFAEIVYEVIIRDQMMGSIDESIQRLQEAAKEGQFLKEKTERGNFTTPIIQLFKQCRSTVASTRPGILAVKTVVQSCSYKTANLLDHMFALMEKYANSLEAIVTERTSLLQEERRRADSLLYQMMPKSVADVLKRGDPVLPETYKMATIYFSDIVGFTNICSDSSPIEVVDMLNSLYNQFDEIISSHDCYKVETIGDAYLVVSGIPKRNGDRHVVEICDMALDILEFVCENFTIPHMRDRKMALRIGIHSGPVAAGVVGLSMPRYCLFGDTVNVASRMESHGIPLKIHLSWSTAGLLATKVQFQLSPRGENFIKGKGMCYTYWLDGKVGKPIRNSLGNSMPA